MSTQPLKDDRAEVEALAHRLAWRYKKSSDPAHSDTFTFNVATLLQFAEALAARASAPPAQAQGEPLTDSFMQTVPDKCDRILWRGRCYHLPTPPEHDRPEGFWSEQATRETAVQAVPSDALTREEIRWLRNSVEGPQGYVEGLIRACVAYGEQRAALATVQPAQPKVELSDDQLDRIATAVRHVYGGWCSSTDPLDDTIFAEKCRENVRAALAGQPAAQQGSTDTGSTP